MPEIRMTAATGALLIALAWALPAMATPAGAAPRLSQGRCSALANEESQSSKVFTSLAQAVRSGRVGPVRAQVLQALNQLSGALHQTGQSLKGAPTKVQSAFDTIAQSFNQLKTQIGHAKSIIQIQQDFGTFAAGANLQNASQVLASYFTTGCPNTRVST